MSVATPTEIGARAEAAVASALVRAGKVVFLPAFGVSCRIDLIYAERSDLVRVQCKTARVIGEILGFRTCSNTQNNPRGYAGEIDTFGVYSPDLNLVYMVPADGLPSRFCSLRLTPTRNGQRQRLRWADAYELGPP